MEQRWATHKAVHGMGRAEAPKPRGSVHSAQPPAHGQPAPPRVRVDTLASYPTPAVRLRPGPVLTTEPAAGTDAAPALPISTHSIPGQGLGPQNIHQLKKTFLQRDTTRLQERVLCPHDLETRK